MGFFDRSDASLIRPEQRTEQSARYHHIKGAGYPLCEDSNSAAQLSRTWSVQQSTDWLVTLSGVTGDDNKLPKSLRQTEAKTCRQHSNRCFVLGEK